MATGTLTLTVGQSSLNAVENIQKSVIVRGTASFSSAADTYATGGLATTFTPLESIHSDLVPTYCHIWSQPAAASPNTFNYQYQYNPGTSINGGLTQIWQGLGASSPEYGNGSALTNPGADTLVFEALFERL